MNKRLSLLAALLLAGGALCGCYRMDVRFLTVSVPGLSSDACARPILDALSKTEGIKSTKADTVKHEIVVEYDARKLAIKNIEFVIAGAGFDAGGTVAPPEARNALPAECR